MLIDFPIIAASDKLLSFQLNVPLGLPINFILLSSVAASHTKLPAYGPFEYVPPYKPNLADLFPESESNPPRIFKLELFIFLRILLPCKTPPVIGRNPAEKDI